MRYDTLIFDLDGTLVDSREAIVAAATAGLARIGLPAPDPATVLEYVGLPLAEVMARLVGEGRGDVALAVAGYRAAYADLDRATTRPFPGIEALLDAVADRPLALATGKEVAGATRVLRELGWRDRFAVVIGGDSVRHPKPHPDMVFATWRALPTAPERTLVIGDTTFDLAMGRAAGAATCAVTWGNHDRARLATEAPDHTVDTVAALRALCLGS